MPYIKREYRPPYDPYIDNLAALLKGLIKADKSGDLNYVVSSLIKKMKPIKYDDYNSIIGALECIKLELYRRKIAPYEDKKIEENGDI
jgi:hypothetical protein